MMMMMMNFYNNPYTDLSTHLILMDLTLVRPDFHDCLFGVMAIVGDKYDDVLIMAV